MLLHANLAAAGNPNMLASGRMGGNKRAEPKLLTSGDTWTRLGSSVSGGASKQASKQASKRASKTDSSDGQAAVESGVTCWV